MTGFELFLITKGFIKHRYNFKTQKNEVSTEKHTISTMTNLDYRYIKNNDIIIFGLHEKGKPTTLISPRPRIDVNNKPSNSDDSMNKALLKINYNTILKAMYDESIILNV